MKKQLRLEVTIDIDIDLDEEVPELEEAYQFFKSELKNEFESVGTSTGVFYIENIEIIEKK